MPSVKCYITHIGTYILLSPKYHVLSNMSRFMALVILTERTKATIMYAMCINEGRPSDVY